MCGCSRSAGMSFGWRSSISSSVSRWSSLHQIDEPEVARAEDDDLAAGDVVLGLLLRLAPGRLAHGVLGHRLLLVAAGQRLDVPARERPLDQPVEPVAVALLERRALCLPMVGQDDELVRARCVAPCPRDPAELLVELAQRLERVGALEARVVGDLVVARERGVDGGAPAHHVGQHAEDDEVAHDHAHEAAHQRIDPAAVPARAHVAPRRPGRGQHLEHDLPDEQDERTRDVEAVGEERAVARVVAAFRVGAADREDDLVGLAGEQVAAAGSPVRQEPGAGGQPALDLGAVRGGGAGVDPLALLLHPAERGDVVVGPEQDAGLAGARLRGQVGLPLGEPVVVLGDPARHVGGVAVAHGVAQHGQRQPVDLEEQDARHVGALARHPDAGRSGASPAACTRRRRWSRGSPRARGWRPR